VRLKVPGVSESILQEYIDLSIDFLHNTPSATVKASVLHFVEILLLAFLFSAKLEEIRDVTRQMLVDPDPAVVSISSRIYVIIFRAVPQKQVDSFFEYLKSELEALANRSGIVAIGDPLVKDLNADQVEHLITMTLICHGLCKDTNIPAYDIARQLMKWLSHLNVTYRAAALSAILNLISFMDSQAGTSVLWILLPFYADPSSTIRMLFSRFQKNIPDLVESHCAAVLPHADDNIFIPRSSWTDDLQENTTLQVSQKHLVDINVEFETLNLNLFVIDLVSWI
jgi:hypothetical protein